MGSGMKPQPTNDLVQCSTFTNVYWDLNIKQFVPPTESPLNWGGHCHGITGILVNPALKQCIHCDCQCSYLTVQLLFFTTDGSNLHASDEV